MKNNDALEKVVGEIQKLIDAEEEKIFSKKVIRECRNPQNIGRMTEPEGFGIVTGPCGDTMEFYINIENGRIGDIRFMTDGCGASIACGSMTTRLARGKTVEEVMKITSRNILDALDGLPEKNIHCARLAADTLQKALRKYLNGG